MKDALVLIVFFACFLSGCTGNAPDHQTPQEFIHYLRTLENIQDIFIQGQDIHVHILQDSTDVGSEEEWNFRNAKIILSLSADARWRNYIDSNEYRLHLHRATVYPAVNFEFVKSYSTTQVVSMHERIQDTQQAEKKIDYITSNFSAAEYHELWLVLDVFENDSIKSGDTLFSSLYINCLTDHESKSCQDYEFIKRVCVRVVQDTAMPVYQSLNAHFRQLDSIK